MGIYIGFVAKIERITDYGLKLFFNFKPIAEIRDDSVFHLSASDRKSLLPKSIDQNINFRYNSGSQEARNKMENYFSENCLVLFEFIPEELDDNIRNGVRNQTGYVVNALDMIEAGKIRKIHTAGVYQVVPTEDILVDFYRDPIVDIRAGDITVGSEVFVDLGDFYAGPYEVRFREHTQSFLILPQIQNNKYTISGYSKKNISLTTLSCSDSDNSENDSNANEYCWTVLISTDDIALEQLDVLDVIGDDALLLESFRENISIENSRDGKVDLDDIDNLLEQYETSLLTGSVITEPIRKKRLNRLVELLTSEKDLTDTLSHITKSLCDLLIRHKDVAEVDEWLTETLGKHPEFWEHIRDIRVVNTKIDQLTQTAEEPQQKNDFLDAEIQEKSKAAEAINQIAIEEKKKEMLEVDIKYVESKKELDSLQATLGVVKDIVGYQKELAEIQKNITKAQGKYDTWRDNYKSAKDGFSELIRDPHAKLVPLAFDGFMSSKMLKAAAEWEAEEAEQLSVEFVKSANSVSAAEKSPEELVDYLIRTVQIARPKYSRNTILNIAICTTQGFLTVFSGEPGCGKTSICNIYSDVLGLNKIGDMMESVPSNYSASRYIPVSVERGWTSKRDFVGYYNPLSKSFDKSNRDVYDALNRLHIEKNKGFNKFPFIILLDEANLSPMEYYWADFMYLCDDTCKKRQINLGDNHVFMIPDTLHFVATINNDHTIEILSPRLIDRAWIIRLPRQLDTVSACAEITNDQIDLISWDSLRKAFSLPSTEDVGFTSDIQTRYNNVSKHLRKQNLYISPRVEIAMKRYWAVAKECFEKELGIERPIVALDYAIAQKVLPKIEGHGEEYKKWLEGLAEVLEDNYLLKSEEIVRDIIERGQMQMQYFRFFS